MTQELNLFVGHCSLELPRPYVPSAVLACEMPGCDHSVWCDTRLYEVAMALKVTCLHCALRIIPGGAS